VRVSFKNIPWKKRIIQSGWIVLGLGTIVLFGAALQKKAQKICTGIQVEIAGAAQNMFLDEKEVTALLNLQQPVVGTSMNKTDLRALESFVEKNSWIQNAEMYFNNQQILQVKILERQPVARVFLIDGGSFYVDSAGLRLPLSDKVSARVPVFTGFPSSQPILAKPDSALLNGIVKLAQFIQADSFWMAQISQVNINGQSNFELIPLVGNQLILLGDAELLDKKFHRLNIFYHQALLQQGLNTYEKLDIRFDNQVVAVKTGSEKMQVDSARAKELIAQLANKIPPIPTTNDTEKKQPIINAETKPVIKPEVKPVLAPVNKQVSKKDIKPIPEKAKALVPKAVLPAIKKQNN